MTMQIAGLALHSLGYADRYDLYFSLDKILWEGQVYYKFKIDMETNNLFFLHQKT